MMKQIKGKSASPGIVIGKALVLEHEKLNITQKAIQSVDSELKKLDAAVAKAKTQLEGVHKKALEELGPDKAQIFEAHLMVLEDPELLSESRRKIEQDKHNAEFAFQSVATQFIHIFENMENEYMRERAADVRDVSERVLRILLNKEIIDLAALKEEVILVSNDLTPSDTATMNKKMVLGFLTNIGGKTSHTAIMARTLEIPAVLGLKNITEECKTGDNIVFNGENGEVCVNPSMDTLSRYKRLKLEFESQKNELKLLIGQDSITPDDRHVKLVANIGTPDDLAPLKKHDAEGVGLYRTEFVFMNRSDAPSEEEQFIAYKTVIEAMGSKTTVIRTLDVGGDKEIPYLNIPKEENPFLGCRAIRYCLQEKQVFKTQLRALLRASVYGKLAIMFPMISALEELLAAKEILNEVRLDLKSENISFSKDIEVGMMIEIPSAAIMSDVFAKHCDFLSIGTNDLVQYTCAVDRMNPKISDLYDPYHPAVLRLINMVIQNGHREGIWVGMCGEMAGQADLIPVLLGMGLHEFSMSPTSILRARKIIRSTNYKDSKKLAAKILEQESSSEVKKILAR